MAAGRAQMASQGSQGFVSGSRRFVPTTLNGVYVCNDIGGSPDMIGTCNYCEDGVCYDEEGLGPVSQVHFVHMETKDAEPTSRWIRGHVKGRICGHDFEDPMSTAVPHALDF
ncbi:hypothetical protein BGZ73_000234 [Actinomortierella ambigua]|nr:hypothetical protein BGZ73_000234 [Actinomortierella ambigua]